MLFHLTQMRLSHSTHLPICLSLEVLRFIIIVGRGFLFALFFTKMPPPPPPPILFKFCQIPLTTNNLHPHCSYNYLAPLSEWVIMLWFNTRHMHKVTAHHSSDPPPPSSDHHREGEQALFLFNFCKVYHFYI